MNWCLAGIFLEHTYSIAQKLHKSFQSTYVLHKLIEMMTRLKRFLTGWTLFNIKYI